MLLSVIGQVLIQVTFLTGMMVWFNYANWYHDYEYYFGYDENPADLANSYLFLFSNFQYLAVAFAFQFNYRYIVPWQNCKFYHYNTLTIRSVHYIMCILFIREYGHFVPFSTRIVGIWKRTKDYMECNLPNGYSGL
jgi:hypothetical protein